MTASSEVVYALPSANPEQAHKHLPNWVRRGYRVIIGQDRVRFDPPPGVEVVVLGSSYAGYARSVSLLISGAIPRDVPVVVFGGDDMDPDPVLTAQEIARQYVERFPNLDGIMQPVGDPMDGTRRICGSPWVGREWLDNANNGAGPFHLGYPHFYADEELFDVSSVTGKLWQREDLTHYHDHWTRRGARNEIHDLLQPTWDSSKALYQQRRAARFPGAIPPRLLPLADWSRLPRSLSAP